MIIDIRILQLKGLSEREEGNGRERGIREPGEGGEGGSEGGREVGNGRMDGGRDIVRLTTSGNSMNTRVITVSCLTATGETWWVGGKFGTESGIIISNVQQ